MQLFYVAFALIAWLVIVDETLAWTQMALEIEEAWTWTTIVGIVSAVLMYSPYTLLF